MMPLAPKRRGVPALRPAALLLAGVLLAATGCFSRYQVTLNDGQVLQTRSRPKLNEHGLYEIKDRSGRFSLIPPGRVRQIERR